MRKKIILIISLLIFSLILLGQGFIFQTREVKAGSLDNVFGWAWSENIGWISFNSTNCDSNGDGVTDTGNYSQCPVGEVIKPYGVNIGADGIFSGYAWSENIGWISFNQADLVGCPSGTCQAKMDLTTGEVSGWARALSYGGGWDGWIKLRGSNYGVSLNLATKEFEGWAWSDMVIGWISFNCKDGGYDEGTGQYYSVCGTSDYKVKTTFSLPPTATNLSVVPRNYCTTPAQEFSWTFSDPEGENQGAYHLQVDKEGNFLIFGAGELDSGKVSSGSQSRLVLVAPNPGSSQLGYNTHYYWRLKVWDTGDTPSVDWIAGTAFDTEKHRYPAPDFVSSPSSPTQGELVQFCATKQSGVCPEDVSQCYDINNNLISCTGQAFLWTFPQGTEFATGTSATSENPQVKFNLTGPQMVSLQITDDAGACQITKQVNVSVPLPKWREVAP